MIHSTGCRLAFFFLTGLPLLIIEAGRAQEEEPAPSEFRLAPEIRSQQAQVSYCLSGAFGGQGSFLKAERETNAYLLGTTVNHQAADALGRTHADCRRRD
jgi:hypothetical protein